MDSRIFRLFSIFIYLFLFIYPAMSSPKLGEFFAGGQGGKMAKNNHWENWEEENADGKMDDPFSIPKAKIEEDLSVGKEPMADGGIGELFERLGRSELIQSIIRMLGQINGREMGEEEEGEGINEEYSREKEQKIERRSAAKSHEKEQTMMRPSSRIINRINVDRKPQMDQPSFYIRSPSIVQQQNNKRPFTIAESIDSRPMTISKNAEEHFIGAKEQSENNQMASIQEAIGKEWKHSLFGRSGLLTEIFNFVNDKRKEGLLKQQQTAQIQQQAAPNLNADKSGNDFAKILDSLLNKAKTGDFDEPLPEIPFIGICNRLSCGDIYKALDEFRKSEFFSNFQTAISLLNDPKGFDMIGELLANPELLENFTGPESLGELFGTGKKLEGKKTATVEIGENTDAENIGVDFSTYIDGKELPKENRPLPKISASIDSGSSDYYSSVDEKGEELEHKKLENEEKLLPKRIETANQNIGKPKDKFAERPLPEIAESIDAKPFDEEDEFPEGPMTFEKNEFLPISPSNNKNQHNGTSVIVMTPKVEIRLGRDRKPQQIFGQNGRTNSSANVKNRAKNSTTEVIIVPIHRTTNNQRNGQKTINLVTKIPSSSSSTTTTQRPLPTTTRRNFRRDNDYYSMYYDDGNGESNAGG